MNTLINIALSQYGVKEIKGQKDHPQIVGYFKAIDNSVVKQPKDETAWCSAFANWVAKRAGYQRSNKLTARSWLYVGKPTQAPTIGDVVVLWRDNPNSWKGHVGFFVKESEKFVYLLGGNQGNSVSIKAYAKNKVLGYRKLQEVG